MEKMALLDRIAKELGVLCLSDLHTPENEKPALRQILLFNSDEYSFPEWSEAVSYITGKPAAGGSVTEIKNFISENLNRV